MNALYRRELRLWLNLFLPSVKLVKKVRVGSKVRRVYDAAHTPFERVKACKQSDPRSVAALEELRRRLDPFQLSHRIERKLARIARVANRRLSPRMEQGRVVATSGGQPDLGCGKGGRKPPFEIKRRFPLFPSPNNKATVTFQMARH